MILLNYVKLLLLKRMDHFIYFGTITNQYMIYQILLQSPLNIVMVEINDYLSGCSIACIINYTFFFFF